MGSEQLLVDWSYMYMLPSVCVLGCVLELISMAVFTHIICSNSSTANSGGTKSVRRSQDEWRVLEGSISNINIFKYLLAYSASDACALFILSFIGATKCGQHCNTDRRLVAKYYELYIYLFMGSALNSLSVLIDLKIAFDRYGVLNTQHQLFVVRSPTTTRVAAHICPEYVLSIFLAVSLIISVPFLFMYEINAYLPATTALATTTKNVSEFSLLNYTHRTDFSECWRWSAANQSLQSLPCFYRLELRERYQDAFKWMQTLLIAKDAALLVVVLTVNVLMVLAFRRQIKRQQMTPQQQQQHQQKRQQQLLFHVVNDDNSATTQPTLATELLCNEQAHRTYYQPTRRLTVGTSKERHVTLLIVCLCALFLLGHTPELVYRLKSRLNKLINFNYMPLLLIVANLMAFGTRGLNFFVYYQFSLVFKQSLMQTVRVCKRRLYECFSYCCCSS